MISWSAASTSIYFFVALVQVSDSELPHAAFPAASAEDLVDEYYTVVPTKTDQFTPQDEEDAQTILRSEKSEAIVASILPYREKMRRYAINEQVKRKHKNRPWIRQDHYPQEREFLPIFTDLCFGLIQDEANVIASYMHNFFDDKNRYWIVIGMILTKDMQNMAKVYSDNMPTSFTHQRKKQKHPFENMLGVWAKQNREPIEPGNLNNNTISQDAQALKAEQDKGGWKETRDQIELILMKKSIKYARAVIQEFEKANEGRFIEDIITDSIQSHDLDKHLANTYASLAGYIKNKYLYVANLLRQYSDGNDCWAAWILCIAVLHPQEWPKVDQVFKQGPSGVSLSQFILQMNIEDKVMAEMMAVIVDPSFTPTIFNKKLIQNGTGQPTTPPPVSPNFNGPIILNIINYYTN